jgi:RHS repeat-associated protein
MRQSRTSGSVGGLGRNSQAYPTALGRRVARTTASGTTRYVYSGNEVVETYDAAGALTSRLSYLHEPDGRLSYEAPDWADVNGNGNTAEWLRFYYHTDVRGSVVRLTDPSGAVVESYTYDVYGQPTVLDQSGQAVPSSPVRNPFLYTGREWDGETSLYHYRARAYDPATGSFLQKDPIRYGDGPHVYQYAGADPVNRTDPYGLKSAPPGEGGPAEGGDAPLPPDAPKPPPEPPQPPVPPGGGPGGGGGKPPPEPPSNGSFAQELWESVNNYDPLWSAAQHACNFFAGWGDMLSFGGTTALNEKTGASQMVDKTSGAYTGGQWTGVVHGAAIPGGAFAGAGRGASAARASGAAASRSTLGEMKALMRQRDKGTFGTLAKSVRYHADKHWRGDAVGMLRSAANFTGRGGPLRVDNTIKWKSATQFLVTRLGKIVSHGPR